MQEGGEESFEAGGCGGGVPGIDVAVGSVGGLAGDFSMLLLA